jgi:hypothetical protein
MNYKTSFLLVVFSLFLTFNVFANYDTILNNEFYLESLRLNELAQEAFEYGDYDASSNYAEEAIRYARLSDEYVAAKLIEEAKRLLNWADINKIVDRYPKEYKDGKNYYESAVVSHSNEELENAITSATKSIEILSFLEIEFGKIAVLPKQYRVRTWATEKDCLWNIAGYPWVYGNPYKWTELYEANKSKLNDSGNPNLIEPGMILDIPSIKGEIRQGMWDANKIYQTP